MVKFKRQFEREEGKKIRARLTEIITENKEVEQYRLADMIFLEDKGIKNIKYPPSIPENIRKEAGFYDAINAMRSNLSYHLNKLKDAGIIGCRQEASQGSIMKKIWFLK